MVRIDLSLVQLPETLHHGRECLGDGAVVGEAKEGIGDADGWLRADA